MTKDINHYADVFIKHPDWRLIDCVNLVNRETKYSTSDVYYIVAYAHNIALHNYNGTDMRVNVDLHRNTVYNYCLNELVNYTLSK